ncbi:hypothetical protein [Devosia sp. DBB001]|nr:hypothetical protein [Devosia sp. DBB001]
MPGGIFVSLTPARCGRGTGERRHGQPAPLVKLLHLAPLPSECTYCLPHRSLCAPVGIGCRSYVPEVEDCH